MGEPDQPLRLSVQRKILLLLRENMRYQDDFEVPEILSQKGIGLELDLRQNHVSRALTELREEGLVVSRSAHIKGVGRKRKVYFLSRKGTEEIEKYTNIIRHRRIPVRFRDGRLRSMKVDRILARDDCPVDDIFHLLTGFYDGSEVDLREGSREASDQGPPISDHFYGRETEIERIKTIIKKKGTPMISVVSMAGMGKTTLMGRAASGIEEYTTEWISLNEWTGPERVVSRWARFLGTFGRNELADHLNSGSRFDPVSSVDVLFREIEDLNILFVLDDYHKAGDSLNGLMACLLERNEGTGSAFLVGSRKRPGFYGREDILVKGKVDEIILEGLDRESSNRILEDRGVPPQDRQMIVDIAKGHPLCLEITAESYQRDPSSIGAEVENYLGRELISTLSSVERKVLYLASAYEEPVFPDGLLLIDGSERPMLESLKERMLLRAYPDGSVDVHDLLKDNIRRWMGEKNLEVNTSMALSYLSGRGSERDIIHYMKLLERSGRHEEMRRMLLDLGSSFLEWGYPIVEEHLSSIRESDLSGEDRIRFLVLGADLDISRGRLNSAGRNLDRALRLCSEREDGSRVYSEEISRIFTLRAEISRLEGRMKDVIESHLKNVNRLRGLGDRKALGKALNNLAQAYKGSKDLERAEKCLLEAMDEFESEDDMISVAFVEVNLAEICIIRGDMTGARKYLERSPKIRIRSPRIEAKLRRKRGLSLSLIGDVEPAKKEMERAYSCAVNCGDRNTAALVICDMAEAAVRAERREEAARYLEGLVPDLDKCDDPDPCKSYIRMVAAIGKPSSRILEGAKHCIDTLIENGRSRDLAIVLKKTRETNTNPTAVKKILRMARDSMHRKGEVMSSIVVSIWLSEMLWDDDRKAASRILRRARKDAKAAGFSKGVRRIDSMLG